MIDFVSGESGTVVTSKPDLTSITRAQEIPPVDNPSVHLYYPETPRLPFDRSTTTEETTASKVRRRTTSYDTAVIEGTAFTTEVRQENGYLRASATSVLGHPAPPGRTITQALQFMIARDLRPFLIITCHDAEQIITIFPIEVSRPSRRGPPLRPVFGSRDDYWRLFSTYMQLLSASSADHRSPARWVRAAILAGENYLEADALGLTVAIEGLIQDSFKDEVEPSSNLVRDIDVLAKLVNDAEIDASTRVRAINLFGSMKEVKAIDRLYALVKKGYVPERLVKDWKRLRNKFAHAGAIEDVEHQEAVDLVFSATTLLYQLIFILCGYNGTYTDYSSAGFPQATRAAP